MAFTGIKTLKAIAQKKATIHKGRRTHSLDRIIRNTNVARIANGYGYRKDVQTKEDEECNLCAGLGWIPAQEPF